MALIREAPVFTLPTPPYPPSGADIFFTPRNLAHALRAELESES